MSRAVVTKSRGDKTKGGASATPTVAHEIVPGKFTDQDWYSMLDRDEGNEFASELLDELVDCSLAIIYDTYIQDQLLPFTIAQAKDAMLQIIDWQFLSRDVLETDLTEDVSWLEDEEPLPAVTDCWAQGIVPHKLLPVSLPSTPCADDIIVEEVGAENEPEAEISLTADDQKETGDQSEPEVDMESCTSFSTSRDGTSVEPSLPSKRSPQVKIQPQPPEVTKPKHKYQSHKGRLKSAGLGTMSESLYETEKRLAEAEMVTATGSGQDEDTDNPLNTMPLSCQSLLKSQAGRPPGNKDVHYDEHGNVISVVKFNPAKLPSHFVKTGFTIVNPQVEAAQARLRAMRTGNYVAQKKKTTKNNVSTSKLSKIEIPKEIEVDQSVHISSRNIVLPLPPPLIEMMEISPGVIVKEGERVKRGAKKWGKTGPQVAESNLRVVRPPPERPRFTAQDILGTQKPMLRLIRDSPVIPPISQTT